MSGNTPFTTRPELAGTFGMVASTHWLASATGLAALEQGGNAFDAAVAAGLVLQVVEPHMNGPAGEVPVIGFDAGRGETFVLDGQGPAPAAATPQAFAGLGLHLVPGTGLLAACVPAAFGTWMLLLARHGRLPLREVLKYAIGYARDGYPMPASASAVIGAMAGTFREHWPSSAEIYLGGGTPAPGSRFANPALAAVYTRILAEGEAAGSDREAQIEAARRAFYEGFVAEAIAAYLARAEVMDSTGQPHRGLLAGADLAAWRASAEPPVTLEYAGLTVCKTGPWGQGPVFLQQLALLAGIRPGRHGPGQRRVHPHRRGMREAGLRRPGGLVRRSPFQPGAAGRPALAAVRGAAQAAGRRGGVGRTPPRLAGRRRAGPARIRAGRGRGSEAGRGPGEPVAADTRGGLTIPGLGPGDTCHLDVADRFGNLVSATPSGGWLQSSPVIPGLGFCLGTRAQMFTLTPGLASTLAPGRRPRTTLSPGLALRDGQPYLAFGTPGGDQQDQWALAFFLNHVHFGMNLQEAIDAPAFHTDHFPSSFHPRGSLPRSLAAEARLAAPELAELRRRGHAVTVQPPWSLGRVSAVSRRDGMLRAGANARGMQGYAVGR